MEEKKNLSAVGDSTEKEKAIVKKVTAVGVFGNIILTAFKLFAGIVGKSGAMVSDAVHSLSDVFATLIAFIGVRMSKRPADDDHPYGHERTECIASLILGLILLVTGLGIGKVGLTNILKGDYAHLAVPGKIALVAAVVSILTKEGMYHYTRHYAKILNSPAFLADAWHHRSDAFSSIGSLVGIAGSMLGYPVLDSVASVVICIFILKVSYDILKDSIQKIMDTSCGADYDRNVENFVSKQPGVEKVDLIHSRMFGSKVYIDIEISVDGDMSLRQAHDIAERVHLGIEQNFADVKHVMVHVNPTE